MNPIIDNLESDTALATPQPELDDAAAVTAVLQGNVGAFEKIMRRYNQRLYRLAVGVLSDPSEAQDVLQESYIKAFYLLATLDHQANLGPWLARIVRNEAIDRLRARTARHRNFPLESDLAADDESTFAIDSIAIATDMQSNPESLAARAGITNVIEQAIQSLPEQFRTVFMLRAVEGLSIKEAAEYLGIPQATIKTREHRAKGLLQARLTKRVDAATKEAFSFMGSHCDAIVHAVLARLRN